MATPKQIEANRRNAQSSTGPRTAAGRSASRMNALKSGIDAKSQIIRGESPAAQESLTAEYYSRFRPATPEQRFLADTLINSDWLLRRFRTVEAQLWEKEFLDDDGQYDPKTAKGITFVRERRSLPPSPTPHRFRRPRLPPRAPGPRTPAGLRLPGRGEFETPPNRVGVAHPAGLRGFEYPYQPAAALPNWLRSIRSAQCALQSAGSGTPARSTAFPRAPSLNTVHLGPWRGLSSLQSRKSSRLFFRGIAWTTHSQMVLIHGVAADRRLPEFYPSPTIPPSVFANFTARNIA